MGRPAKSAAVLQNEGVSHRTKDELAQRKAAEKASLSGIRLRESPEVKLDPIADGEFKRVRKILDKIGKNDALFEATINDYCIIKSDIFRLTELRKQIEADYQAMEDTPFDSKERFKMRSEAAKNMLSCDKQIAALMKKRFDIEKESGFTVASALRAIPKKVEKKGNPLLDALNGDE